MASNPLQAANQQWGSANLVAANGQPLSRSGTPMPPANTNTTGGGGNDLMIDIAGLKQNVNFLNWALGAIFVSGLAAIIACYLLLSARIDDRYDKIGDKIEKVSEQIDDLRVGVSEFNASYNPQASTRIKQPRSVHPGIGKHS